MRYTKSAVFSSFLASLLLVALVILPTSVVIVVLAQENAGGECSASPSEDGGSCATKWVDDTFQFLQSKVFGQSQVENSNTRAFLTHIDEHTNKFKSKNENDSSDTTTKTTTTEKNRYMDLFDRLTTNLYGFTNSNDVKQEQEEKHDKKASAENKMLQFVLEQTNIIMQAEEKDGSAISGVINAMTLFRDSLKEVSSQLKHTFEDVLDHVDFLLTIAMIYYLGKEDAIKNPTWKRQQHRFYDSVSKSLVIELHDALYLSQLSYVHTLDAFQEGLSKFQNNTWQFMSGTTESLPNIPAHFLIVHKQLSPMDNKDTPLQSILPWEASKKVNELQICFIVRGTKDLADVLSDGLLKPTEYRDGHAHTGILSSGKALVEKYLPKFEQLLEVSGRDTIRLYLVGHSLGAGAAAIAAMEFNEYDFLNVEAVGFGCPPSLSRELSLSTKDYVTTVVSDADVVPRMSGAAIVNVIMDLLEFDFTGPLLQDVLHSVDQAHKQIDLKLNTASKSSFFGSTGDGGPKMLLPSKEFITKWLGDYLTNEVRPSILKRQGTFERMEPVLIPPGNCIHLYRDGVGYTSAYTPCDFFTTIDVARTMIDDHMVMAGYHKALINLIRDWNNDDRFDFVHDIAALPV